VISIGAIDSLNESRAHPNEFQRLLALIHSIWSRSDDLENVLGRGRVPDLHGEHRALRQDDWAEERVWLLNHERCGMPWALSLAPKASGPRNMVIDMNVDRDMIVVDGVRMGSV